MSRSLQLPEAFIQSLAHRANWLYRPYYIAKRNGTKRLIHHPASELKALQRWLSLNVIKKWPVHPAAFGYRVGRSIGANAAVHSPFKYLLRMDFKDFFPSITDSDLRFLLATKPPDTAIWSSEDASLFLSLVCLNGRLTIGAPTSPALSNCLCLPLDEALSSLAGTHGAVYSRYADDIFFSTNAPSVLCQFPDLVAAAVAALPFPRGLTLNSEKTRHLSRKSRRTVTGVVLSSDGSISVGRKRKRHIRSLIHGVSSLDSSQVEQLRGQIWFVASVDPDFINALVLKYGSEVMDGILHRAVASQDESQS